MPSKNTVATEAVRRRPKAGKSLYESDFYSWARAQADALRTREPENLDWVNLAEEMEDLANRNADALESQAERLIAHLLKMDVAPSRLRHDNLRIWELSVRDARRKIKTILKRNPGLKPRANELFVEAWPGGRDQALAATAMPDGSIPESCPWDFERAMQEDFVPKSSSCESKQ
jgi:hypothetical protein